MIADETVQRILTVLGIVVVQTGILRKGGIVDVLGITRQVVNIVNTMTMEHRVGFYKSTVLEVTGTHPECTGISLTTTGASLHSTCMY